MSDLHWDRLALRFLGIVVVAFDFNDVVVVFLFDFSGASEGRVVLILFGLTNLLGTLEALLLVVQLEAECSLLLLIRRNNYRKIIS